MDERIQEMQQMNVTWWVLFIFGLTIGFYLTGFTSGAGSMIDNYNSNAYINPVTGDIDIVAMFNDMATKIFSWNGLLLLAVGGGIALTSGLNLLALIPLGAIMLIVNFLFIPLQTIRDVGLPIEVTNIMVGFFVLAEIITVFMLIRGNFR